MRVFSLVWFGLAEASNMVSCIAYCIGNSFETGQVLKLAILANMFWLFVKNKTVLWTKHFENIADMKSTNELPSSSLNLLKRCLDANTSASIR